MMKGDKNGRKVHIFIDISNILIGAKELTETATLRLNVQVLLDIVTDEREVARKVWANHVMSSWVHSSITK